ncbi:DNA repair exonuclease SbcCD ATPase subunit [Neobacillus niacini]|uniref:hypothetical protein n=1 Tax=Neobacillus niacini TaxID=86668 RepID=UPI00285EFE3B|nr:hypothetical protein [Neobacillus niacini]MDR7079232.1 DNA repair exonuclease SbcCD ATPase subunit [Neobacillus niacini]
MTGKILSELQKTNGRLDNIENSQMELTKGQKEISNRIENVEKGQEKLTKQQKKLSSPMENLEKRQTELVYRVVDGHNEILELLTHFNTLMNENFTALRNDIGSYRKKR